jgi:hypothetical protein
VSRLVVVTASTNLERSRPCVESWHADEVVVVLNGPTVNKAMTVTTGGGITLLMHKEYLGTVAAFKAGVDFALDHLPHADVIACLHDDFRIDEQGWQQKVLRHFDAHPATGLLGFGGAIGLGADNLYQVPYQPMQLARIGFRSNLVDAEVHGVRSLLSERVACLDGFSQIGRREFWEGHSLNTRIAHPEPFRPWHVLDALGIKHHFYDGMLGALAARYGWETWYLPVAGKHFGGATAVGDQGYQAWAQGQTAGGDHGFWEQAHAIGYEAFRDVLPLRV